MGAGSGVTLVFYAVALEVEMEVEIKFVFCRKFEPFVESFKYSFRKIDI